MKYIKLFEEFITELNKKTSFSDSNIDDYITPKKKGWYVGYRTESGDESYIKVNKEPKNKKEAMKMIKSINSEESYTIITTIAEIK